MNSLRNLLIGATAIAAATAMAGSALAASDSATVSASVIQPISITKVADVNFGTVARPSATGTSTITINATTGAETASGGGLVVAAGSRGSFTVTGDGGRNYTIAGNTTAVTLTRTGGSETLTFNPSVVAASGTLGTLGGANFSSQSQTLYAGGTFDIDQDTVSGAYTGTLTLTVNYQ